MARTKRHTPLPPNARQRRFIDEYLRTSDAPASAIAAGYSKSQAKKNAGRLLRAPSVAHVLRAELDARAERTRIAADRIVLELARVAFSDIGRVAEWRDGAGWGLRPFDELSDADRAAIARVRLRDGDVQVQLHDKIRALDALGKYFKLWGKHADKLPPRQPGYDPQAKLREARAALAVEARKFLAEKDAKLAEEAARGAKVARRFRIIFSSPADLIRGSQASDGGPSDGLRWPGQARP
jgi:phage terminase small subunit